MRFIYTQAMLDFIAATYAEVSLADTTRLFNHAFGTAQTEGAIKSCLKNHRITCGRSTGELRKGVSALISTEQRQWIVEHYPAYPLAELHPLFCQRFGGALTQEHSALTQEHSAITIEQLRSFIRNHGIKSGRDGRFVKGQTVWNKGMKGLNTGGRSIETRFKKGKIAHNHRPVGSERVNVEGYIECKVAEPNRWRLKQRVVWEQANGPLKPGELLWFKDNNPQNCCLDNLMVVSRAQHAVVNRMGLQHAQGDGKRSAVLIADIKMAITRRRRPAIP